MALEDIGEKNGPKNARLEALGTATEKKAEPASASSIKGSSVAVREKHSGGFRILMEDGWEKGFTYNLWVNYNISPGAEIMEIFLGGFKVKLVGKRLRVVGQALRDSLDLDIKVVASKYVTALDQQGEPYVVGATIEEIDDDKEGQLL